MGFISKFCCSDMVRNRDRRFSLGSCLVRSFRTKGAYMDQSNCVGGDNAVEHPPVAIRTVFSSPPV